MFLGCSDGDGSGRLAEVGGGQGHRPSCGGVATRSVQGGGRYYVVTNILHFTDVTSKQFQEVSYYCLFVGSEYICRKNYIFGLF